MQKHSRIVIRTILAGMRKFALYSEEIFGHTASVLVYGRDVRRYRAFTLLRGGGSFLGTQ